MTRKKKKTLNMGSRQKKAYSALNKRLAMYTDLVRGIIEDFADEASRSAQSTGYTKGEKPFAFSDYPETRHAVTRMKQNFVNNMSSIIYNGVSQEWRESNLYQDMLAEDFIRETNVVIDGQKRSHYYETDNGALKAFRRRQDKGLRLSTNIWNQAKDMQTELEATLSCAIEKGMDAVTLSKRVSKYLRDYDKIKKDYKELYGKAVDIHDCEYRSMRLARSEINMAYRSAENARWQDMDFVIGMQIKTSNNHSEIHTDVCDELAGKYPKDFDWVGWHPNCRCFKIPILKKPSEAFDEDGESKPSPDEVKEMPDNFKKWVRSNEKRILAARDHGTEPYFIRDNRKVVNSILDSVEKDRKTTPVLLDFMATNDAKAKFEYSYSNSVKDEGLTSFLQSYAEKHPENFHISIEEEPIEVRVLTLNPADPKTSDIQNGYMASHGNVLIIIDNRCLKNKHFNPYPRLKETLKLLPQKKKMRFDQEYSIEALWHEIKHMSAVKWRVSSNAENEFFRVPAEVVNQFCARMSYPTFMQQIGGKSFLKRRVMKEGYGYNFQVANFLCLLKAAGWSNRRAYKYFKNRLLTDHYENMYETLVNFIVDNDICNHGKAMLLVRSLGCSPSDFAKIMDSIGE